MGIFDKIKKLFSETPEESAPQPTEKKPAPTISPNLLETADIPPKPLRTITGEYGDSISTFSLSGDFIEFNSHCELDPSYQYEPDNNEDYTAYKENTPYLFFGPFDDAYDDGEEYVENGKVSDRNITESKNPYFLFSAKYDYFEKEILYAYVFAQGTEREFDVLGVAYNREIEGTALEKKLCAILDETALSYKEESR